eukprot:CFRG8539T1
MASFSRISAMLTLSTVTLSSHPYGMSPLQSYAQTRTVTLPPTLFMHATRKYLHDRTEKVKRHPVVSDHYARLGLKRNCSQDDVKKAFFQLSKLYHPDKFLDNSHIKSDSKYAHDRFVKLSEAYGVLSNPQSRRDYDFKLNNAVVYETAPTNRGHTQATGFHRPPGGYASQMSYRSMPSADNWLTGSGRHFLIMTLLCTVAVVATLEWVKSDIENARRDAILTSNGPIDVPSSHSNHARIQILRAELDRRRRARIQHQKTEYERNRAIWANGDPLRAASLKDSEEHKDSQVDAVAEQQQPPPFTVH